MSGYVPDNLDLYDAYEARQRARERHLPICDYCGERIYEDYYDIDGDIVCCDCLDRHFKIKLED